MCYSKKSFVLLMLALLAGVGQVHAYQPYGYQPPPRMFPQQFPGGQQYPVNPYQPAPYQDNRGQLQPYWTPYRAPTQQEAFQPPTIEATVSDPAPYEQQSLIYRVRVTSSGNVKTITPELPQTSSVVLRALGDPLMETIGKGAAQQFVTEYRYLLMPLAAGDIEIPPAVVHGVRSTTAGTEGPAYKVTAQDPVVLSVRPASEAVQPWLPLYNLRINAQVSSATTPEAGTPVTMEIETTVVGATGAQIPSVADQLSSEDFRIYPGKSVTEGGVSEDGDSLVGRRVESFTLVPLYGGRLKLPSVSINWWNVRYNRPEVAAFHMSHLIVKGPPNPERGFLGTEDPVSIGFIAYWIPLMIGALIMLYGWISALFGPGRLPGFSHIRKWVKPVLGELYGPVAAFMSRISPRRRFHRIRTWTGRKLPISWKLWFCLRAVECEDDPSEWGHALQILAAKHLGVRPHSHLKYLGSSIVACHPRANAKQVERLMQELDEAVYGDRPIRSFERWKREFKQQIKPGLFPLRFRHCKVISRHTRELPQLNPQ